MRSRFGARSIQPEPTPRAHAAAPHAPRTPSHLAPCSPPRHLLKNRWYLSSIGQHDLLDVSQERLLAMDVQELIRWHGVRSSLERQLSRPPSQDEWSKAVGFEHARSQVNYRALLQGRCFEKQLRQLQTAKEKMINSNLRLVVHIAKGYANRGLGLQDLIQEGTLGLITAVDKFDPSHESQAKFSSYASWWIKQRVRRAVDKAGAVRLPARMPSLITSVLRCKDEYVMEFGREPTHAEIASSLGISTDRLRVVLSARLEPVSLDREVRPGSAGMSGEQTRTLADLIPNTDPNPQEHLEAREVRTTLARSLHPHLSAEEHAVICSCYNLIEHRESPLTYAEIGRRFGRNPQWAAKVEARALKKLKGKPMLRNLLATRDLSADGYEIDC